MKKIYSNKGEEILVCDSDYKLFKHMKWNIDSMGYARTYSYNKGRRVLLQMHRFFYKSSSNLVVDHINRNKLDNRRCNLRQATRAQNAMNVVNRKKVWRSGYRGVMECRLKSGVVYRTTISHNNGTIYIGSFPTKEEAARAYDKKCLELRGEFAVLNFPDDKV